MIFEGDAVDPPETDIWNSAGEAHPGGADSLSRGANAGQDFTDCRPQHDAFDELRNDASIVQDVKNGVTSSSSNDMLDPFDNPGVRNSMSSEMEDGRIDRLSSSESDRCRELKEAREKRIEMRRKEEAELLKQQKELATEELNEFYKKRDQQIERRKKENRIAEERMKEELDKNLKQDKSWTRVVEMINENEKFSSSQTVTKSSSGTNLVTKVDNTSAAATQDTSKMKKLLQDLAEKEEN